MTSKPTKSLPYVIQYPSDFEGCGFWRVLWPQYMLNIQKKGIINHSMTFIRDTLHYAKASAIVLQRQGTPNQLEFLRKLAKIRHRLKFRLIYEVDDALFPEDIPEYNFNKPIIVKNVISEVLKETIELCDEMTVTTPTLRKYYLERTNQKNISIIPNYPPKFWIGHFYNEHVVLFNYHKHKNRPRILYTGSPSHFYIGDKEGVVDDFSHIQEVVINSVNEFQWVFVGAMPKVLIPYAKQGLVEFHPWKTMEVYPHLLATLGVSMAIAPLNDNLFNRCKSDLKFLEAAALGLPIACQDLPTYAIAPIRFTTGKDLIEKIRKTLGTEEGYIEASRLSRSLVESRWLENSENIGKYVDLYTYPFGDPFRKHL